MIRALAIVALCAGSATAQPEHPYAMKFGRLDTLERSAKMTAVGETALAAGDRDRAARAFAIACWSAAFTHYDPDLKDPVCARTRELQKAHSIPDVEIVLLGAEGAISAWLFDVPRAIDRLQKAIAIGNTLDLDKPDSLPALRIHFTLGALLGEGGRYDQALAEIELARTHARIQHHDELLAWTDTWLCRTYNLLGNPDRATEHCAAADAYLAKDPDRFLEMDLRWQQGGVEFERGRYAEALVRYRASYELANAPGGELLRGAMRLNIGAALVALGKIDEGKQWYDAMDADITRGVLPAPYAGQIAEQQGELAMRRTDLAEAERRFEIASTSPMHWLGIRSLGRLASTKAKRGDLAGARAAHEDAIRRIETDRTSLDGSLQRTLFMALHAAPYRELAAIAAREPGGAERALEIAERGRARGLLDALSVVSSTAVPVPLSAVEIRTRLQPDQLLIEYLTTETGLLALAVTRDAVRVVELPRGGALEPLGSRIALARKRIETAASIGEAAPVIDPLARDVLAPVLAVAPAARTILIAADGPLHELPFEAIASPDLAIVRVPSGSMLGRPRGTGTGIVVVAPPDTAGLGDLARAREEASSLAGRFEGAVLLADDRATRPAILEHPSLAVLHFAGHAVIDPVMPLRSALVLAPSKDDPGWWRAAEIYMHRIDAQLVVLSACSTARGAPGGGEGVASLARAFLHSGARVTVATAWDVGDAAAERFVDRLYAHLAEGNSIAAAAAETRRELRDAPPHEWAGFTVTGEPTTQIELATIARPSGRRWLWIAGGVLGLLIAAAFALRFRRA